MTDEKLADCLYIPLGPQVDAAQTALKALVALGNTEMEAARILAAIVDDPLMFDSEIFIQPMRDFARAYRALQS